MEKVSELEPSEGDCAEIFARRIFIAVERRFESNERLRLGKWHDPDERARLIIEVIADGLREFQKEQDR